MEHLVTVLALLALVGGATAASLPLSGRGSREDRRARRDELLAEQLAAHR